jgi:hypothetical protein
MGVWTGTPHEATAGARIYAADWNGTVRDGFEAFGADTAYTPTWGSSGTAPAIGNGSIIGAYSQIQKRVFFRVGVTFGTTSTFGTGNYTLTLPVAPSSGIPYWSFLGYALQGGNAYTLTLDVNGGSTSAALNYQSSLVGLKTRVTPTAPLTWTATTGNGFWFSGTYEAA